MLARTIQNSFVHTHNLEKVRRYTHIVTKTPDLFSIKDPLKKFKKWYDLAQSLPDSIVEPSAMCLATATRDGKPSCRMILMKSYGDEGFKFFTNYSSRKGQEIENNPYCALNFFWEPMLKAVRIEGKISKLSEEESKKYFYSRPIGSQIGSSISPQSTVIESREFIEGLYNKMAKNHSKTFLVPYPQSWGGYVVVPSVMEFWHGRQNRLHDRIRFRKLKDKNEVVDDRLLHSGENGWVYELLAP